jgi:hypothetical protein
VPGRQKTLCSASSSVKARSSAQGARQQVEGSLNALLSQRTSNDRLIERNRPKHHNETLTWSAFTRMLLYFFTKDLTSGNELIVSLQSADPDLNLPKTLRRALSEGFWRFSPKLLQATLTTYLATYTYPDNPEFAFIGPTYAVDGSIFPLIQAIYWPKTRDTIKNVKLHLFARLSDALTRFWKISKHWLHTLADCLSRPYTPDIVCLLNKYAV